MDVGVATISSHSSGRYSKYVKYQTGEEYAKTFEAESLRHAGLVFISELPDTQEAFSVYEVAHTVGINQLVIWFRYRS